AGSARDMSLAAFRGILETKLVNKGLLKKGRPLSDETVVAAKSAAEVHGNTGRSPTFLIDPASPNPYTPGTIAADRWDAIGALHASNPTVQALRLRLQLPGQQKAARYKGLPYELMRAQHYAGTFDLLEVERPTTSASAGNGECDLLLTGGRLIDCKA